MKHDAVNALLDLSSIKDVRFSVSKIFWAGFDFYNDLEPRVSGTLLQWVRKNELRVRIAWDDGEQEPLPLVDLLSCGFQLERYADNRPAPHPKRRRNAAVAAPLPVGGNQGDENGDNSDVQDAPAPIAAKLKYNRGGREFTIDWKHISPEGITIDARTESRWRPEIAREKVDYKTPYLMWSNVALPWNFMEKMLRNSATC